MKKRCVLALLSIAFCAPIFSQKVTETVFGDSGWNFPIKIWEMPDGNLALVSGVSTERKLFHLDPAGKILADFPLPTPTASNFVQPAADGASFFYQNIGATGYEIHHLDLSGQPLNTLKYTPPDPAFDDYFFSIEQAPNGDFVLAYQDYEPPQGVRVVRLKKQGGLAFAKYIASDFPEFHQNHLTILPDGRTVVLVLDFSSGYRVVCYSPTGSQLWTKGVPHVPGPADGNSLLALSNGNTVLYGRDAGLSGSLVAGYAAAYRPNGSFAYNRTFENELPNFKPSNAFADGDFLVLAGEYSDANEYGMGVIKLDPAGKTVFAKNFTCSTPATTR